MIDVSDIAAFRTPASCWIRFSIDHGLVPQSCCTRELAMIFIIPLTSEIPVEIEEEQHKVKAELAEGFLCLCQPIAKKVSRGIAPCGVQCCLLLQLTNLFVHVELSEDFGRVK